MTREVGAIARVIAQLGRIAASRFLERRGARGERPGTAAEVERSNHGTV